MLKLLPKPIKANILADRILINKDTKIATDKIFVGAAHVLIELISKSIGATLDLVDGSGDINFIKDTSIVKEGYIIDCKDGKINICASEFEGAFYAVQTLRLQFNMDTIRAEELLSAAVYIEDAPKYLWRGLMIDVSRHFMEIPDLKRFIDMMALHKLNILHLHLTDDQGWRVEIKKYPLLTTVGSKRKDTQINGWRKADLEGKPHEGFYTQEEIKDIVAYAAERAITVVPEIDIPAHFAAAMAAYNHLACREIPCEVFYYNSAAVLEAEGKKYENRSACAGKESTYEFIFDVLDELCELFPAPYFHIGGDEAPKDEWKVCPQCQERMKQENLKSETELQGYFNNRIYAHLKAKGKRMIGWNEVLASANLDSDAIAQYWTMKRDKNVEKFVKSGGKVILSKFQSFYFDMCYAQIPLKNTYKFDPAKIGIPRQFEKNVLGVEGELWTEWIKDNKKRDVNLFPRMEALAEVGWCSFDKKDYDDFLVRLESFNKVLEANGIWYAEQEVADPKGPFKRSSDTKIWYESNQNKDVEYNEIAKANRKSPTNKH